MLRVLVAVGLLTAVLDAPAAAQARVPLSLAADPSGVLSAIRAVDLRQLCACPVVLVDSIVHRSPRLKMFDVLDGPAAGRLGATELGKLALARHRPVGTRLRTMTAARRDTALLAAQLVPTTAPAARVLVVVTPPNGITAAFLVSLAPRRASWLVSGVQAVYEP